MNEYRWVFKDFPQLTNNEVFDMLQLRCEVFIVEQNCPYQDPDKKDKSSFHLLAYDKEGSLAGCLRLVKPGISYEESSIGRVCTKLSYRRSGLGKVLMSEILIHSDALGYKDIRISAQHYLEKFYQGFGFETKSDPYMEDDIPHVQMLLKRES